MKESQGNFIIALLCFIQSSIQNTSHPVSSLISLMVGLIFVFISIVGSRNEK